LTDAVWKLELTTRGVTIELEPEQSQRVAAWLKTATAAETMTGDEAEACLASLEALLTTTQLDVLDSFGRPFRPGGGPGGGMGFGGGRTAGGSTGGPGGSLPPDDSNPLADAAHQETVSALLARLQAQP
jgi:hypothetical protein